MKISLAIVVAMLIHCLTTVELFGEELVTGINIEKFLKATLYPKDNSPLSLSEKVTEKGIISYRKVNGGLATVVVGIWPSKESARASYTKSCSRMQTAPDTSSILEIGDESQSWVLENGGYGGSVFMRRLNVTISITWPVAGDPSLRFAKILDDQLKGAATEIVEKGTFQSIPKIVGLPANIELDEKEKKTFSLSFEGFGADLPEICTEYATLVEPKDLNSDTQIFVVGDDQEYVAKIHAISSKGVIAVAELKVKPKPKPKP